MNLRAAWERTRGRLTAILHDARGLKPCPFCRHRAPEIAQVDNFAQVQCPNCNAAGPGILNGTPAGAGRLWNRRHLLP